MFNRRRMFPRQKRTYLNPVPENNQERAEQHIEDESEEEKEQLTSEPIETSRAVVHTLMPRTYVVISMNFMKKNATFPFDQETSQGGDIQMRTPSTKPCTTYDDAIMVLRCLVFSNPSASRPILHREPQKRH